MGSCIKHQKLNMIPWKYVLPCIFVSMPFAFLGGNTQVDKEVFVIVLAVVLILSGMTMMMNHNPIKLFNDHIDSKIGKAIVYVTSSILGYIAGLVGIGGGIFFAPILHLTQTLPVRIIPAFTSFFILANSLAGLAGQMIKNHSVDHSSIKPEYLWLFIAVFLGGQLGSHLGLKFINSDIIRRMTAVLVIYVGCRLLII